MTNQYDTYLPDPARQAQKKIIESVVQVFRGIWVDMTPKVDVIFTDQNPFTPPAGKPVYLKEWQLTCSDGTVTIKIKAARLMMECDVLIIQRYPIDKENWTIHQVEIIDNEQ